MHVRLFLKDLLLAGVPCSTSSFRPTSRTVLNQEIGASESERANSSNLVDYSVRTSNSAEGTGEVGLGCTNRKRKGKAPGESGELKKSRAEASSSTVVKDSGLLLGRLLLWSTTPSSHPGNGSNSLDCLAFCDGSSAVCCTVQRLDVELLGQYVQVNSWTFVPAVEHSERQCNGKDGSTVSDAVHRLEQTGCFENPKLRDVSENERLLPQALDCGGCLEIHSLRILDQPFVPIAQVLDFPSLCLSPAATNTRNLVLESPLEKKGKSKRALGLLHCISLPFLLPSKSSLQDAPVADDKFLLGQDAQKSLFKDESSSRVQSNSQTMLGFLVELRSCCHGSSWQLLRSKTAPSTWTHRCNQFLEQEVLDPGKDGIVAVYFSGAVASWRPVLSEMIGGFIAITGLRRKMIQRGPEGKGFDIYVATRITLVFHIVPALVDYCNCEVGEPIRICKPENSNRLQKQPRGPFRHLGCLDGSCKSARSSSLRFQHQERILPDSEASYTAGQGLQSYVGKITCILMQDQLLELDDKVWLLLTHCEHTRVHGLRVGALVAVRHAHIMSLKSISEKLLVLGACLRSHVGVVIHSISNAGSRISQVSESLLTKYIRSLPFASAFWALHVITSLRCKLKGAYSDTELLGTMKCTGLIRKILPSMIATSFTLHRDVFNEFFSHKQCCLLGDNTASILLSKVPPLSNFCKHVEMLSVNPTSSIWHKDYTTNSGDSESGSKMTRFCKRGVPRNSCYVRIIISGVKLGVVLVGSLKVCQSTGKLRLVDATGAFDVVVPDLRSFSNLHCLYQITEYKLVMEGEYKDAFGAADGKSNTVPAPLSWSSLLKGSVIGDRVSQSLSYYVKFSLRYAKRLEGLTVPSEHQSHRSEEGVDLVSASDLKNDSGHAWKGKEFHIALVTHKYPAREKFSPDKEKQWAFDIEVVLLPYSLLIHEDHDACIDSPHPLFRNLDFSSSKVEGAIEIRDRVTAHERNRLEELGSSKIGAHAHDSIMAHCGCLIECRVRCLVEQSSGLKKSAVRPWCTSSASLLARGCPARTSISGSSCASKEKHWATLSEAKLQKLVLAVNWRAVEINQLLNSGDWCLLPTMQDKSSASNPSEITSESRRVEIDSKQPLLSLQWRCAIDGQLLQADAENFRQTVSSRRGMTSSCDPASSSGSNLLKSTDSPTENEEDGSILKMGRSSDHDTSETSESTVSCEAQLVDAVLIVSDSFGYEFGRWLASLKRKLISQLLNVSEALQLPSRPALIIPKHCSGFGEMCDMLHYGVKLEASSGTYSLQGEVVSIQGKLEATECSDDPVSDRDDKLGELSLSTSSGRARPKSTVFQLRDPRTNQLIRIDINFDKYVRPVGFGPGAVACFRRILLRRDANVLVGMPTTDILVDSVEKRIRNFSRRSCSLPSQEQEGCARNDTVVDLLNDFIRDLEPRERHLRVCCRVVSVQGLELEWRISQSLSVGNFSGDMPSLLEDVGVKWGCFIIDDGSAVAECWANGDQAVNFLGFRELAGDLTTFCPSIITLAQNSSLPIEQRSALGVSFPRMLRCLVRKHKRICVRGEPPQGDAGTTSWLIKGADGDLEESEAAILGFFLKRACQLGPKIVHCTTMSDEDHIFKCFQEHHLMQTCFSASTARNSRPWQHLTWNRTQLAATKVDVLNTCFELQRLFSSFDL